MINLNAAGTYAVVATNPVNGCTATSSFVVTQDITPPNLTLGNAPTLNCLTTSAQLTVHADSGVTFAWSGQGIVGTATGNLININAAGSYTVIATNPANGCTASASLTVNQDIAPPVLTLGNAPTLNCLNTSAQLTVQSATGVTFAWSGPGIVGATTGNLININAAGSYTIIATNPANGCTASASLTVNQDITPPALTLGNAPTLNCLNTSAQLTVQSATGVTFAWSGPGIVGVTTGNLININAAGSYTVIATNPANGCTASASLTVNQDLATPVITTTNAALSCITTSAQIFAHADSGTTFLWNGPAIVGINTGNSITVNAAGTYTVIATNPISGCTASATVLVVQNTTAPVVVCGSSPELNCLNTTAQVSVQADAGSTFLWNGPGIVGSNTTSSITVNAPGTYSVVATNPANGCTSTASIVVTQNVSAPSLTVSSAPQLNCTNAPAQILVQATAGTTFLWTGPSIVGSNTGNSITVDSAGTYTVVATNPANGCTATASFVVKQNTTAPVLMTSSAPALNCQTSSAMICAHADAGTTFLWAGPSIVGSNSGNCININAAGSYTVVATSATTGCTSSATVVVMQNTTAPALTCGSSPVLDCQAATTQVCANADAGTTFLWTGPGIVGSNTGNCITVNAAGTYVVVATNPASGCTATAAVVVTQHMTAPNLSLSNAPALSCTNATAQISALSTDTGLTFLWTGPGIVGSTTTATITVNAAGTYTVVATNAFGCTATMTVQIDQNMTTPTLSCGSAPTLSCANTMAQVCVNSDPGVTFSWNGPAIVGSTTANCITVTAAGVYTVIATNSFGCTASTSVTVAMNITAPTGTITAPAAQPLCSSAGNILSASVTGTGNTYQWSVSGAGWSIDGSTNTNPIVYTSGASGTPGVFTLVVTNTVSGCSSSATLTLTCNGPCHAPVISSGTSTGTAPDEAMTIVTYPNPVVSTATIQFTLNRASSEAMLDVYDGNFAKVGTLFKGKAEQGVTYRVLFDGDQYPNGTYYFRVTANDVNYVNKLVLIK